MVAVVDADGGADAEIAEEELEDAGADADEDEDADGEGGMASDTDASDADASLPEVEILSPRAPAQFYAFEQVPFRGVCRGAPDQATPSARFVVSGPMPSWSAEGNEASHRFELPGSYKVQLVCRDTAGVERRATLDLTIYLTPSLAYMGLASGATSDAVFGTRLDQLGEAIQMSPKSQALAATISEVQYNALQDRVLVKGKLFHRAEETLALVSPCRSAACAGQDSAYEELVPEAHGCAILRYAWAPDGHSVFASYWCNRQTADVRRYWVDLSVDTTRVHALATSERADSSDSSAAFAAGGVLLFQVGTELKAMDTRAADHPLVSLGSVAGARWQLSPAGDRLLILGDKGYALETSALMGQAEGARRELSYQRGAPRALQAAATHLVYTLELVHPNGTITYESGMMRWDGSHDAPLCTECWPQVCGDRIALDSMLDDSLSVLRIAEGASSDIVQTIPLSAGAPPAAVVTDVGAPCTLVRYQSDVAPYFPYVLWDTESGEWTELPGNHVSPDGRHVSGFTGLWPIARSPLRVLAPVTSWPRGGDGAFSPDGKHFLATGQLASGGGSYQIDLDTHQIARLTDRASLVRFSEDGIRVLLSLSGFDQRVVEYAVPAWDRLWQSARGTADWATVGWQFRPVPNSRAVAYTGVLAADGIESIYRTDLGFTGSQRFGALVNTGDSWELSLDGSMLGIESAPALSLWSFDAEGAAAPRAQKVLDAQTDCQTLEVGPDGFLCVTSKSWHHLYWLDAKTGVVGELDALPATGEYWEGTRGPEGGTRGMLFGQVDSAAAVSWLDFENPGAPRIEPVADPKHQGWILTPDRRYLLKGLPGATTVTDLATGQTRALTKANDQVGIPGPDQYYPSIYNAGRIAFSDDYRLFWVDLAAAVVTASPRVGRVLTLHRLGPDVSRVLVSSEDSLGLVLMGEQGENTVLYKHESQRLGSVLSSPDGRWIMFATPEATFVTASDGKTPTREIGPAIDLANFDRTGRFLVGRLTRSLASPTGVEWKMWKLDTAESPLDVAPGDFQHRSGVMYWIQ